MEALRGPLCDNLRSGLTVYRVLVAKYVRTFGDTARRVPCVPPPSKRACREGGQQLFERLRRLQIEGEFSLVEALPQVLDRLHDTPGEGGLSPYHILFGRERPLGGLPYEHPVECEDALLFFKRMKRFDEMVASILDLNHSREEKALNKGRTQPPPLFIGIWFGT